MISLFVLMMREDPQHSRLDICKRDSPGSSVAPPLASVLPAFLWITPLISESYLSEAAAVHHAQYFLLTQIWRVWLGSLAAVFGISLYLYLKNTFTFEAERETRPHTLQG